MRAHRRTGEGPTSGGGNAGGHASTARAAVLLLVALAVGSAGCDRADGAISTDTPPDTVTAPEATPEALEVEVAAVPASPQAPAASPQAPAPPPPGEANDGGAPEAPSQPVARARSRKLQTYHLERYSFSGFDAEPALYRDGRLLVVRWWVEHLCDQAVQPRVERRGDRLLLRAELGPDNRCMPEWTLYESRIPDPNRTFRELEVVQGHRVVDLADAPTTRPPERLFPKRPARLRDHETPTIDPWAD